MDVRDAVEADADELAELTDSPRDVMRNLVHDRTVRVVEARGPDEKAGRPGASERGDATTDAEPGASGGEGVAAGSSEDASAATGTDGEEPIRGFVSYDAREETVHVTQLEGDAEACDRLLEEPIRFARTEGMTVELLVPEDEAATREAAENAGLERAGSGPSFEGQPTVRYRLDPR
ncbi:MAG: hypothetical protein ABEJ40_05305 [Haloarculaceae archaeon]